MSWPIAASSYPWFRITPTSEWFLSKVREVTRRVWGLEPAAKPGNFAKIPVRQADISLKPVLPGFLFDRGADIADSGPTTDPNCTHPRPGCLDRLNQPT